MFLLTCCLSGPLLAQEDDATAQIDIEVVDTSFSIPESLMMRARVKSVEPSAPSDIAWRYGGEGLGGGVVKGVLGKNLSPGQWSPAVAVSSLAGKRFPSKLFLTFTAGSAGRIFSREDRRRVEYSTNLVLEVEFSYDGKVLKTVTTEGPDGGTAGIVIQASRLAGNKPPTHQPFIDGIQSLREYVTERAQRLEALPWASWPVPEKFMVVTDLNGYGTASGYKIRHTDPMIVETEARALRQLGVNALRGMPDYLAEMVEQGEGYAAAFRRGRIEDAMNYPTPYFRKGREDLWEEDPGCPFAPAVAEKTAAGIAKTLALLDSTVDEVWGLTDDEIGSVFDNTPEGKSHMSVCDRCAVGYQEFLQAQGVALDELGAEKWADVRPSDIYSKNSDKAWENDPKEALNRYYTRAFNNYASARLFTPLRDAVAAANRAKQEAIANNSADPVASQPWLYTYALRGNTFLMKGHSLDFFEFYRHADNGFSYETSNRDARIWQWDSYLCDVGRVVGREMGLTQSVYIKPHRGAPVQRALTAVARGNRMLYWYTYGPDYAKGDSFSEKANALELTSKGAHLIGKAEDALWQSAWQEPARIAIVKPNSSEYWKGANEFGTAAWENAKWTYTALTHAHLAMDPIDEVMIEKSDLSRYDVIYFMGPNITRAAAAKLTQWVQDGGTLYTSGYGLALDERNEPLTQMLPVLGLKKRGSMEMWRKIDAYGAGSLQSFDGSRDVIAPVPSAAALTAQDVFARKQVTPTVGREVLVPDTAKVLANYADGGAAATVNEYGKGTVYVVGVFAGLEYSAPIRTSDFDMSRDLNPATLSLTAAPALTRVTPRVAPEAQTVEAVLMRHPENGKRALVLMNWAYRVEGRRVSNSGGKKPKTSNIIGICEQKNLRIRLRDVGDVTRITSCMLDQQLPITRDGEDLVVTLPHLEEGDVLLIE